ncbi:universal stress protein [Brevibacterium zhoupengii]|uniref:universal stress protein n=1 Tax=Brevibacterium zhoupengii TaxID=2898795 RepID=UPI001E42FBAD|nr:universal stress protein [Brevibacterium zhoupengii]
MTIIAAFPYGKKDRSALHLAGLFARSSGEDVRIVSIVPEQGRSMIPSGSDLQFAAWSRERGRKAVAEAQRAAAEICPDIETESVAVPHRSRAKGLIAEVVAKNASMLVVGSGTEGTRGRIRVSGTSDRLLHSSPVPVALAPKGLVTEPGAQIARVTCSFRGDSGSDRVLAKTAEISQSVDAALRVATFGVGGRTVEPSSLEEDSRRREYAAHLKAIQARAVDKVDEDIPVEEAVGIGKDWKAALGAIDWMSGEVLVIGSSSEGRRSKVFLGSNAARIIRHTPAPVVVVVVP